MLLRKTEKFNLSETYMISELRLNGYHIMWLFVFFDMPVQTKLQTKRAAKFRQGLLKLGFGMMQYSVYVRHCPSVENAKTHIKRVKSIVPPEGYISILMVTDKQYGEIVNIWGKQEKAKEPPKTYQQLEMF